jgi:hypothetical protein
MKPLEGGTLLRYIIHGAPSQRLLCFFVTLLNEAFAIWTQVKYWSKPNVHISNTYLLQPKFDITKHFIIIAKRWFKYLHLERGL